MKYKIRQQIFLPARTNQTLIWVRNIFLTVGIVIMSYVGYTLLDSYLYQADQTRLFEQSLKAPYQELATVPDEGTPLGRIEISQIGLSAMILEGTGKATLDRAVGHIQGTSLPGQSGNIAIAGHRDTFFRGLRNINHGDEIKLTTANGSRLYRVDSTKVVEPEETEVLNAGTDDIITLVTCFPFRFIGPAPQRFIVRAHRITGQQ